MFDRHHKLLITAVCVGAFPFVLELLMWSTPDIGLIWLLPHQLYYAPLSEIGEPFFVADSDVGFWVQWPGRALALLVYVGGLVAFAWAYRRWRARKGSGKTASV